MVRCQLECELTYQTGRTLKVSMIYTWKVESFSEYHSIIVSTNIVVVYE